MFASLAGALHLAARRLPRHGTAVSAMRVAGAATGVGCAVAVACGWTATTEAAPANGQLVMSGDCGGTNTRLVLFRVAPGAVSKIGEQPAGEVVFAKKYLNEDHKSFVAVRAVMEVCAVMVRVSRHRIAIQVYRKVRGAVRP